MARFSRARGFLGEMGSMLKSNPLIASWHGKEGGIKQGFKTLRDSVAGPMWNRSVDAMESAKASFDHAAARSGAAGAAKESGKLTGRFLKGTFGPEMKYMGAGAAVGLGYGGYRHHRDGHVSARQLLGYSFAGAALGAKVGTVQMFRHDPTNPITQMAASPWRAWKKSGLKA